MMEIAKVEIIVMMIVSVDADVVHYIVMLDVDPRLELVVGVHHIGVIQLVIMETLGGVDVQMSVVVLMQYAILDAQKFLLVVVGVLQYLTMIIVIILVNVAK